MIPLLINDPATTDIYTLSLHDALPISADLQETAEEYRAKLIEAVAEADEELLEKYLEGEELTIDEIKAGIRKLTIAGDAYPVLCGSAFKNKGVQPMLDAVKIGRASCREGRV